MNPLDNLKDIQTPAAISNWPPAYGWWLLGLLIIISIFIIVRWLIQQHKLKQPKKQALKEVNLINTQDKNAAIELNQILKRATLAYFPQLSVQSLHGSAWSDFLIAALPAKHAVNYAEPIKALQNGLYQKHRKQQSDQSNILQQQKIVSQWLKLALPPNKKASQILEQKHA